MAKRSNEAKEELSVAEQRAIMMRELVCIRVALEGIRDALANSSSVVRIKWADDR